MKLKWKRLLSLGVAVAGILVPLLLWQADRETRSLELRLVSETALQPEMPKGMSGLQIVLGNNAIKSPSLSVLELRNDGSVPIVRDSFEEPLEIVVQNDSQLIRVQVTGKNPTDLSPKVTVTSKAIRLEPLLLNAGDSITIAVLAAKRSPVFAARSRIAGIRRVTV
jgi:hypothetical protein